MNTHSFSWVVRAFGRRFYNMDSANCFATLIKNWYVRFYFQYLDRNITRNNKLSHGWCWTSATFFQGNSKSLRIRNSFHVYQDL
ncbi:hypothetical protein D3C86_1815400 [compost metagenome]